MSPADLFEIKQFNALACEEKDFRREIDSIMSCSFLSQCHCLRLSCGGGAKRCIKIEGEREWHWNSLSDKQKTYKFAEEFDGTTSINVCVEVMTYEERERGEGKMTFQSGSLASLSSVKKMRIFLSHSGWKKSLWKIWGLVKSDFSHSI